MKKVIYCFLTAGMLLGCNNDDDVDPSAALEAQVVEGYANIVLASYEDAVTKAKELKVKVDAFVANPTDAGLKAARQAWIDSRPSYLQTEAYRFYGGPIDGDDGLEGEINAWPLDEVQIDYVESQPTAGIINNVTGFPTLSKAVILAENGAEGEADVKVGYHAIEFLLWGQDFYTDSPGKRPYTDYVTGGTASNQARRGQYLKIVTDLLIEDLETVTAQWKATGDFRTEFLKSANTTASLTNILSGIGKLTKGELSGERMTVALENQDQEDEHSCFSDNTTNDIIYDEQGIYNVYLGKYTRANGTVVDGIGFDDLVKAKDAAANTTIINQFEAALAACKAIPAPFDQAIINSPTKVQAAILELRKQADQIQVAASKIGITLVVPETND